MSPTTATVTILLLVAVLGWALVRLWRQRGATQDLLHAIVQRRPMLRSSLAEDPGRNWAALREAVHAVLEETARLRQLRASHLAQLEATLGSLREAVLVVDAGNRIVLANQAMQEIFPSATRILGQRLEAVLRGVAFLNYVEAVRRAAATPQQEIEFAEGRRSTWVEVSGALIPPLDGGQDAWALFVLHDITRQKKLEAVRRDFVANVSHELRTPLSVIKGYVETLENDGIPADDRKNFLRAIHRHTDRLNSLIEDLLTLSRLESSNPGLRREPTDLATLLAGVLDDYRARPAAAGHQLAAELGTATLWVPLDPLKITQAVENLLDNALKYTPPGSRIILSLSRGADETVIGVRDDGPGIPADDLPHIFERFYRVEKGRSREQGGTGLGLSIVKHLVLLHGGRVWAESTVGQGSAFFLGLPPAAPAAPAGT